MEPRSRPLQAPPTSTRPNARRREVTHAGLTWTDVTQPTTNEVAYLRERHRLDALALEDVLSTTQRPKLDRFPQQDYLFLIMQVPALDRDNRLVVSEVALFVGRDFVITLHDGDIKPLRRMFSAVSSDDAARTQLMARGAGYLCYRIADTLLKQCFPMLYRIEDELRQLDTRLWNESPPTLVRELAETQRDVITLRHILLPNLEPFAALRDQDLTFVQVDAERYFGDCVDSLERMRDMLAEQQDVIGSFTTVIGSQTAQRTNQLVRLGVIMLIVLLPLLLISSLVALNAVFPVLLRPLFFGGALLAGVLVASGVFALLHYRKWL